MRPSVVFVLGTRPEVIKLAPVIHAFRKSPFIRTSVVHTGQHRDLAEPAVHAFDLPIDVRLQVMDVKPSLLGLTQRLLPAIEEALLDLKPNWVFVQGDTATAWTASWVGFMLGCSIAHVEAGLRTYDLKSPFPEEANRRLISTLASRHYAPTEGAKAALLREGVASETIRVTGNTVVDALEWIRSKHEQDFKPAELARRWKSSRSPRSPRSPRSEDERLVLVTLHRRESWDTGIEQICQALDEVLRGSKNVRVILPIHPSPSVRAAVLSILSSNDRVTIVEPLDYVSLLTLMAAADLIVSDSGGIQEEAPSFQKRILIAREHTERPEVIQSGFGVLVGTRKEDVKRALIQEIESGFKKPEGKNPFGDGKASERILEDLLRTLPS